MITRTQLPSGDVHPGPVSVVKNAVVLGPQTNSVRGLENLMMPMVVGPIVETFLFLMAYKLLEKVGGRTFAALPFMIMLGVLGWALHGAGRFDVGPALGFAVVAFVFFRTAKRHGLLWAFIAAALAHIVWNSIALGIFLIRN
jgi:hypothetical protein